MRARDWVVVAVAAVAGGLYSRLSSDWTEAGFYAGVAVVIAMLGLAGNVWVEMARDGAFSRRRSD
jgi:hypothetical protein